jgi:hypothetical protein
MNTFRSLWLILPVCLAACASPTAPVSTTEIDAATSNLGNCLGRAAEQMDDGKSDARTVGLAIEPVCATQFSQVAEINGRSLNPAAYNLYLEKMRPDQLEFAANVVLKIRALRAQQISN